MTDDILSDPRFPPMDDEWAVLPPNVQNSIRQLVYKFHEMHGDVTLGIDNELACLVDAATSAIWTTYRRSGILHTSRLEGF